MNLIFQLEYLAVWHALWSTMDRSSWEHFRMKPRYGGIQAWTPPLLASSHRMSPGMSLVKNWREVSSPDVKKRREREFHLLKQGPMTMVQYETQFRELERFALDLVPTERRRIERFYERLQYEIRMAFVNKVFATFRDVV